MAKKFGLGFVTGVKMCLKLSKYLGFAQTEIFHQSPILIFNPLKTKRRLLYLKTQLYRAVNTFHLGYKNQSVYYVSGTSRCLFSDKYKTVVAERTIVGC